MLKTVAIPTSTGTGDVVRSTSPTITTPTLAGDVNLSTGNLVVGTSGKGIDFSANPAAPGVTSELLDDFEYGTWTPQVTFNNVNVTTTPSNCRYIKIGKRVYVEGSLTFKRGAQTGAMRIVGFPFSFALAGTWPIATLWGIALPAGYTNGFVINNANTCYFVGSSGLSTASDTNIADVNVTLLFNFFFDV